VVLSPVDGGGCGHSAAVRGGRTGAISRARAAAKHGYGWHARRDGASARMPPSARSMHASRPRTVQCWLWPSDDEKGTSSVQEGEALGRPWLPGTSRASKGLEPLLLPQQAGEERDMLIARPR
jgi:hypothetical protein